MSYENLEKALEMAKQCEGYWDGGKKADAVISKAEELLGFKLSKQNTRYFTQLGFMEFYGHEIYGIVKDDFSGTPTGCSIEAALIDRKDYQLPREWLPIYFFDDGYMGYLDYGQLNDQGEPPVIMAIYNGEKYVVTEKVAEDLGDFILGLVEKQLEREKA